MFFITRNDGQCSGRKISANFDIKSKQTQTLEDEIDQNQY